MIRMFLTLLTSVLVMAGTFVPAEAVPICPGPGPSTMVTYIGFGAGGCNLGHVNFSNFSYSGQTPTGNVISPEQVEVGAFLVPGGSALELAAIGEVGWGSFELGFDAEATSGLLIAARLELFQVDFTGPFQGAGIDGDPGLAVSLCSKCEFGDVYHPRDGVDVSPYCAGAFRSLRGRLTRGWHSHVRRRGNHPGAGDAPPLGHRGRGAGAGPLG